MFVQDQASDLKGLGPEKVGKNFKRPDLSGYSAFFDRSTACHLPSSY